MQALGGSVKARVIEFLVFPSINTIHFSLYCFIVGIRFFFLYSVKNNVSRPTLNIKKTEFTYDLDDKTIIENFLNQW